MKITIRLVIFPGPNTFHMPTTNNYWLHLIYRYCSSPSGQIVLVTFWKKIDCTIAYTPTIRAFTGFVKSVAIIDRGSLL